MALGIAVVGAAPSADAAGANVAVDRAAVKRVAVKKKARKVAKDTASEPVAEVRGIDTSLVWRGDTEVFSAAELARLEPILRSSSCTNDRIGCLYQDNGRPGSEDAFSFRLIPWKVSRHRGYLVRNDRCGAGGCDEGLFVLIDGQWRLLIEIFGTLYRDASSTDGFHDLIFQPRGQEPVRLVWDGRAYRATAESPAASSN